jgi:hypothetical protein
MAHKMKALIFAMISALMLTSCFYEESVNTSYDYRDNVVGYYEVEEYSQTFNDKTYYDIDITRSGYGDEVWIDNFYAADISVKAIVNYERIRIPLQIVDGYEIEGSGIVRGSRIDFTYSVRDRYNHSATDFCETTAWLD